jgi:uridine kinase
MMQSGDWEKLDYRDELGEVLPAIRRLLAEKETVVVAIDGRCGSGKTVLSQRISQVFPCNLLHMDDFYLPIQERAADWKSCPGGNMDFDRFLEEALLPARQGRGIEYRPYSCQKGRLEEAVPLSGKQLTVVEGSYALHPRLEAQYDLKIFLTCWKEKQIIRLMAREGENYPAFAEIWIPMEERYFAEYRIEEKADFVLDTSEMFE